MERARSLGPGLDKGFVTNKCWLGAVTQAAIAGC